MQEKILKDKIGKKEKFISLLDASKLCNYSQDYLSLRARQKKLKSRKIGRNWYTTEAWLNGYIKNNGKGIVPDRRVLLEVKQSADGLANKRLIENKKEASKNFLRRPFNLSANLIANIIFAPFFLIGVLIKATGKEFFSIFKNIFRVIFIFLNVFSEILILKLSRFQKELLAVKNKSLKIFGQNLKYFFRSCFFSFGGVYEARMKKHSAISEFLAGFLESFDKIIQSALKRCRIKENRFKLAFVLFLFLFAAFLFQNPQLAKAGFFKFAEGFSHLRDKTANILQKTSQKLVEKNISFTKLSADKYSEYIKQSLILKTEFLAEIKNSPAEMKENFTNISQAIGVENK